MSKTACIFFWAKHAPATHKDEISVGKHHHTTPPHPHKGPHKRHATTSAQGPHKRCKQDVQMVRHEYHLSTHALPIGYAYPGLQFSKFSAAQSWIVSSRMAPLGKPPLGCGLQLRGHGRRKYTLRRMPPHRRQQDKNTLRRMPPHRPATARVTSERESLRFSF